MSSQKPASAELELMLRNVGILSPPPTFNACWNLRGWLATFPEKTAERVRLFNETSTSLTGKKVQSLIGNGRTGTVWYVYFSTHNSVVNIPKTKQLSNTQYTHALTAMIRWDDKITKPANVASVVVIDE